MLILQRATLPRFASDNGMSGTAEENKAVVQGSIAYFGTDAIDEAKGPISLRYDGSTYPNWDGDTQERLVSISGNEVNSWVTPKGRSGARQGFLGTSRQLIIDANPATVEEPLDASRYEA